jgi:hypothetical protein
MQNEAVDQSAVPAVLPVVNIALTEEEVEAVFQALHTMSLSDLADRLGAQVKAQKK